MGKGTYDISDVLGQKNISDTVIINTAGLYGLPVTGVKQLDSYEGRQLYLIDITDYKSQNDLVTKVPMNHYQIIKCALTVQYPDSHKETVWFEYSNNTELIFRLGQLKPVTDDNGQNKRDDEGNIVESYEYMIGSFKCTDVKTVRSVAKIGDYFDKIVDVSTNRPVLPYKIYALTPNKNLVQD